MEALFKSVLRQDRAPIVLCDLEHKIIYMNPSAIRRYKPYGGEKLLGSSLLNCHDRQSGDVILKVVEWFKQSTENNMIYTYKGTEENKDVYMVALREASGKLIGYYEKHEYRNAESAKLYDFEKPIF